MGSGKTSWAIQEMNENIDKSYVYITPFLNEVERIKNSTNIKMCEPINKGQGKLDSFNELLSKGYNIVSTHSLFTQTTDETKELLNESDYTLILDEVLDVIELYTKCKDQDIKLLIENNFISIDEDNYVIWNQDKYYPDCRYSDIQQLAKNKCLIYVNNKVLLWQLGNGFTDGMKSVTEDMQNAIPTTFTTKGLVSYGESLVDTTKLKDYSNIHNTNTKIDSTPIYNINIIGDYNITTQTNSDFKSQLDQHKAEVAKTVLKEIKKLQK